MSRYIVDTFDTFLFLFRHDSLLFPANIYIPNVIFKFLCRILRNLCRQTLSLASSRLEGKGTLLFLRHAARAGRSPLTRRGVPSYLRGIARAATLSVLPSAAHCGPFAAISRSERATRTVRGTRHPSGRVRRGSHPFFPPALYSLVCAGIIHHLSFFRVNVVNVGGESRGGDCQTSRRVAPISVWRSGFDRVILSGRETHFGRRHSSVSLTFSRYVLTNTRTCFLREGNDREREKERGAGKDRRMHARPIEAREHTCKFKSSITFANLGLNI